MKTIDANTGFTLLLQNPIFKAAFMRELDGNDRPFMTAVADLLTKENVEDFWIKYGDRFGSRERFDRGLRELQDAARLLV